LKADRSNKRRAVFFIGAFIGPCRVPVELRHDLFRRLLHRLVFAERRSPWPRAERRRQAPDAEFRPIQTIDGHLALFGADPGAIGQLDKHLRELLGTEV
jgi:hypothetical protein